MAIRTSVWQQQTKTINIQKKNKNHKHTHTQTDSKLVDIFKFELSDINNNIYEIYGKKEALTFNNDNVVDVLLIALFSSP